MSVFRCVACHCIFETNSSMGMWRSGFTNLVPKTHMPVLETLNVYTLGVRVIVRFKYTLFKLEPSIIPRIATLESHAKWEPLPKLSLVVFCVRCPWYPKTPRQDTKSRSQVGACLKARIKILRSTPMPVPLANKALAHMQPICQHRGTNAPVPSSGRHSAERVRGNLRGPVGGRPL